VNDGDPEDLDVNFVWPGLCAITINYQENTEKEISYQNFFRGVQPEIGTLEQLNFEKSFDGVVLFLAAVFDKGGNLDLIDVDKISKIRL